MTSLRLRNVGFYSSFLLIYALVNHYWYDLNFNEKLPLTESQVFRATFPLGTPLGDFLLYLHSSSSRHQRPKSPIIAKKGWEVMRFRPHKAAVFSCVQHFSSAVIPMSDKLEFQLTSISLSSVIFSAKVLRAVSVKLSTPAMFKNEMLWQFAASVWRVRWEAAHWRKLRCWREGQQLAMSDIPRSVMSSHQDISKSFNWEKCRKKTESYKNDNTYYAFKLCSLL